LNGKIGDLPYIQITLPKLEEKLASSSEIDREFITSLECLLYRIYLFLFENNLKRRDIVFRTDAAIIEISLCEKRLNIDLITTRICLGGLKIATMIYWRLMSCCVQFGIQSLTLQAYPSNESLLKKIGGFMIQYKGRNYNSYKIVLEEMSKKTLETLGLSERLHELEGFPEYYTIRPSYFPNADELNDQQAVDKRYTEIRRKRIQEQVSEPIPTPRRKRKRNNEESKLTLMDVMLHVQSFLTVKKFHQVRSTSKESTQLHVVLSYNDKIFYNLSKKLVLDKGHSQIVVLNPMSTSIYWKRNDELCFSRFPFNGEILAHELSRRIDRINGSTRETLITVKSINKKLKSIEFKIYVYTHSSNGKIITEIKDKLVQY
jgi:hypothetical protein